MCWRKLIFSSTEPRDQLMDVSFYPTLIEYGLLSNQIRTNDIRNVVLLVVDPSSIHHYILGMTNTITVFTWWWKSSDMEIPMSCCWAHQQHFVSPMIHVENQPSVGNFYRHFLHAPFMKYIFGWKKWLPRIHVHLVQVAAMNLRKVCFASSGIIPS